MNPQLLLNITTVCLYSWLKYVSSTAHLFYAALQLLSILASLAALNFSTFHHKQCDFRRKEVILNVKFVFWFSRKLWNISSFLEELTKHECTRTVRRSSCKTRDVLVRFQLNMNYLDIFSINPLTSNFTKTHSVETELFHADRELVGQTDRQTWWR